MPILYKYLPPERLTYLDNQLLRFTQPSALNDPFECIPVIEEVDVMSVLNGVIGRNEPFLAEAFGGGKQGRRRAKKMLPVAKARLKAEYTQHPEYLPNLFLERYIKHSNRNTGIFSLSRRWDSTLMWSHYTSSHQGFCVGFHRDHAFFTRQPRDPLDIGEIKAVQYDARRLSVSLNRPMNLPPSLFHRKSPDWSYEEEERLVRLLSHSDTRIEANPSAVHLFRVPHSAIAEIIYGVGASQGTKDKVISVARQLDTPVWEALVSRTCFDIDRKQVH
jgi:hypothetical protein